MTTQAPGQNSTTAPPAAPAAPQAQPVRRAPAHDASILDAVMDETLKYRYALEPTTMEESRALAADAYRAKLVGSVEEAQARILIGRPLGLPAMACIQKVYLLENKRSGLNTPCIAAAAKLGILLSHPKVIEYVRPVSLTPTKAVWVGKRRGDEPVEAEFSIEDAKRALLVGRGGGAEGGNNFDKYPVDMLSWRACGRVCDRIGADILLGIATHEDVADEFKREAEELAGAAARGDLAAAVNAPAPHQTAPARDWLTEAEVLSNRTAAAKTKEERSAVRSAIVAFAEAGAPADLVGVLKKAFTAAGKVHAAAAAAPVPIGQTVQAMLPGAPAASQAPAQADPEAAVATDGAEDDDLGGRM